MSSPSGVTPKRRKRVSETWRKLGAARYRRKFDAVSLGSCISTKSPYDVTEFDCPADSVLERVTRTNRFKETENGFCEYRSRAWTFEGGGFSD